MEDRKANEKGTGSTAASTDRVTMVERCQDVNRDATTLNISQVQASVRQGSEYAQMGIMNFKWEMIFFKKYYCYDGYISRPGRMLKLWFAAQWNRRRLARTGCQFFLLWRRWRGQFLPYTP